MDGQLMTTTEPPEALSFSPPLHLFAVTDDNGVVTKPLHELHADMRAAIANPWRQSEENCYVIGVVRGRPGQWMLDVGNSLGKLEQLEEGWVCVGLARMAAIAQGLALETAGVQLPEPKTFTAKLLRRAGKGKKKAK